MHNKMLQYKPALILIRYFYVFHMSAPARLLALWFRIPPGHGYLFVVSVVRCQVEVTASGCSLVQRSPTNWGVSDCDRETAVMRTPWPTGGLLRHGRPWSIRFKCSMLCALIMCVQFSKEPTNTFGLTNVILFPSNYRTCFGHSSGHLQGDENKNSDTTIMCWNHSRFNNHKVLKFWLLCNKITFINSGAFDGLFKNCTHYAIYVVWLRISYLGQIA